MRLVRPDDGWCILFPSRKGELSLQGLALRSGYRVNELCAELECNRRYLYEVFLRDIGLAPKEWMRRERMAVARRMLTGGQSPEVAAADLGFATANSFRREFLRFYQVGPVQFQQESHGKERGDEEKTA